MAVRLWRSHRACIKPVYGGGFEAHWTGKSALRVRDCMPTYNLAGRKHWRVITPVLLVPLRHPTHPCSFLSGRTHSLLSRLEMPKKSLSGKTRHVTYSWPMGSQEERWWVWRLEILKKKKFLIEGGRIPGTAKQKNRSDIIESHDRHVSQGSSARLAWV